MDCHGRNCVPKKDRGCVVLMDEREDLLGEAEHPEGVLDDSILSDEEREAMDICGDD